VGEAIDGRRPVRRTATLASLAAELGVSRTTVSNAYNRPDQLSPALRRRVLDTARRLGYPGPDPVARSLRTRKAGAVGLLLTEALSYAFRDPVAVQFLEGLALACEDNGSGLLLVPVSPDAEDVGAVARAGVDGFVVYSMPDDDEHFGAVLERPVPVVVCDQPTAVPDIDRVGIDDHAAMKGMAHHLSELGHRDVGVLCMRLSTERNDGFAALERQTTARYEVQRRRLAGLRDGFAEAGVDWSTVPVVERYEHSEAAGVSAAEQLLAAYPHVTAVVCTSDILALGALRAVRASGREVPADVTVTGFDGVPAAERAQLTTIRQPTLDKGRAAGELLLDRGDRQRSRTLLLPTDLLVRGTSGPARTGALR
jgi:DNA-binding LacI/PurR family transcriptional regulator